MNIFPLFWLVFDFGKCANALMVFWFFYLCLRNSSPQFPCVLERGGQNVVVGSSDDGANTVRTVVSNRKGDSACSAFKGTERAFTPVTAFPLTRGRALLQSG